MFVNTMLRITSKHTCLSTKQPTVSYQLACFAADCKQGKTA